MNQGIKTIIYPVTDLAASKKLYRDLLGVEPDGEPYYVGFRVAGQDVGLDPNGHRHGMTAYWHVDDIEATLRTLLASGAEALEPVKDVGGGKQIASVKDANGNVIGLLEEARS